mmetsp:Transcript_28934/g.38438  ORF Transcript_28934/g.38438 Transcript_28934/m.38438 type:complete len:129 (-) Transcript_28934:71-457(-)
MTFDDGISELSERTFEEKVRKGIALYHQFSNHNTCGDESKPRKILSDRDEYNTSPTLHHKHIEATVFRQKSGPNQHENGNNLYDHGSSCSRKPSTGERSSKWQRLDGPNPSFTDTTFTSIWRSNMAQD